jgi:hypothetical protein
MRPTHWSWITTSTVGAAHGKEPAVTDHELGRDDVKAALAARRELGPDYDDAVADALVARVEAALEARGKTLSKADKGAKAAQERALGMALGSLGIGVPLTAIAGGITGLPGIVTAWAGIAVVNVAYAWGQRRG